MSDWVRQTIVNRLHGTHIHVDPLVAIEGISETNAVKIPFHGGRSLLELMFHIVFWQDYSLGLLSGEIGDFVDGLDWDVKGESWRRLEERFRIGFSQLESIIKNLDLDEKVKISDELTTCVGAEIIGIIQHTSYHLGQLITTRRALGLWPQS